MAVKLDATDLHILAELESNGRITNKALAARVGLSDSPCLTRVSRLEKEGYITGYHAQIELSSVADLVTVFTEITLRDRKAATVSRFEQSLRHIDELQDCSRVRGDCDYILKFLVNTVAHYRDTIMKLVDENSLIDRYFSYFVVRTFEIRRSGFVNTSLRKADADE